MTAASDIATPRPAIARVRALSGNSDVASAGVQEIASAVPTPLACACPEKRPVRGGGAGGAADGRNPPGRCGRSDGGRTGRPACTPASASRSRHVADDEPLHVAERQPEVRGDRRQRHVDGDVERAERGAQPDDGEAQRSRFHPEAEGRGTLKAPGKVPRCARDDTSFRGVYPGTPSCAPTPALAADAS